MQPEGVDSEALITLMSMGFEENPCRRALSVCGNDVNRSVEFLFSGAASDQEVVDMTVSPNVDSGEPQEWVVVRARYNDSQTIVFEECADALELAVSCLRASSQSETGGPSDDQSNGPEDSGSKSPSREATLAFVHDSVPFVIRIVCVEPGCWIGRKDYEHVRANVAKHVMRILLACVRLAHQCVTMQDFTLCPQLKALLSEHTVWYTGRLGQAGVASHRNEVLATVMQLHTLDHLLQRAECLLATPPAGGNEDEEEGDVPLEQQTHLVLHEVQTLASCVFAAPDLLCHSGLEGRAERLLAQYLQFVAAAQFPPLKQALVVVDFARASRTTMVEETVLVLLDHALLCVAQCDVQRATPSPTQDVDELMRGIELCGGQNNIVVYQSWLKIILLMWQSPALARHLFALTTLENLVETRVEAVRFKQGPVLHNHHYLLDGREFTVDVDHDDGTYDVRYVDSGERARGVEISFHSSVSREVPVCPLTRAALLEWMQQHKVVVELFGVKRHQQLLTNHKTTLLLKYLGLHGGLQQRELEAMLGAMCTAHETEQVEVCALLLRVLPQLPQHAQATLMRCATQVLPLNLLASFLTQKKSAWWCDNLRDADARATLLTTLWLLTVETPLPDAAALHSLPSPRPPRVDALTPPSKVSGAFMEGASIGTPMSIVAPANSPMRLTPVRNTPQSQQSSLEMDAAEHAARCLSESPPLRRSLNFNLHASSPCPGQGSTPPQSAPPLGWHPQGAGAGSSGGDACISPMTEAHASQPFASEPCVGAGTRPLGIPVGRLCDLLSRLLDADEREQYLSRCVQQVRQSSAGSSGQLEGEIDTTHATAGAEAEGRAPPGPRSVAQQLAHTERVLDVLRYILHHAGPCMMLEQGSSRSGVDGARRPRRLGAGEEGVEVDAGAPTPSPREGGDRLDVAAESPTAPAGDETKSSDATSSVTMAGASICGNTSGGVDTSGSSTPGAPREGGEAGMTGDSDLDVMLDVSNLEGELESSGPWKGDPQGSAPLAPIRTGPPPCAPAAGVDYDENMLSGGEADGSDADVVTERARSGISNNSRSSNDSFNNSRNMDHAGRNDAAWQDKKGKSGTSECSPLVSGALGLSTKALHRELLQLVIAEMRATLPLARRAGISVTCAVRHRLKFIHFLMSSWAQLGLASTRAAAADTELRGEPTEEEEDELVGVSHLETLWGLLVHHAAPEREPLLEWLARVGAALLSPRTRLHVFTRLLCPVFTTSADAGRVSQGSASAGVDEEATRTFAPLSDARAKEPAGRWWLPDDDQENQEHELPPQQQQQSPAATLGALRCFCHYFLVCNADQKRLTIRPPPHLSRRGGGGAASSPRATLLQVTDVAGLTGTSALWTAVLCCPSEPISAGAVDFLLLLHQRHRPLSTIAAMASGVLGVSASADGLYPPPPETDPDAPSRKVGTSRLFDSVMRLLERMDGAPAAGSGPGLPVSRKGERDGVRDGGACDGGSQEEEEQAGCTKDLIRHRALTVLKALLAGDAARKLPAHQDIGCGTFFQLHILPGRGVRARADLASPTVCLDRLPGLDDGTALNGSYESLAQAPILHALSLVRSLSSEVVVPGSVEVRAHSKMSVHQLHKAVARRLEKRPDATVGGWLHTVNSNPGWCAGSALEPEAESTGEGAGSGEATASTRDGTDAEDRCVRPESLLLEKLPECTEVVGSTLTLERAGVRSGATLRATTYDAAPATSPAPCPASLADSVARQNLDVLFRMLERGSFPLKQKVWQVLQLLPTSAALQQQFSRPSHVTWSQVLPAKLMHPYTDATHSPLPHPGPSSENETSDSNLKRAPPLQDTESPPALTEPSQRVLAAGRAYRVVYTLQLIDAMLMPGDCDQGDAAQWRLQFMRAGGFAALQDFFMGVDLQWLHEPKLGEPLQLAIGLCLRAFKCLMHLALAQSAPVAMADAPALPTPSPAVSGSGFEQADELPRPESLEQGETARSGREVSEADLDRLMHKLLEAMVALQDAPEAMQDAVLCLDSALSSRAQSHLASRVLLEEHARRCTGKVLLESAHAGARCSVLGMLHRLAGGSVPRCEAVLHTLLALLPSVDMLSSTCAEFFQLLGALLAAEEFTSVAEPSGGGAMTKDVGGSLGAVPDGAVVVGRAGRMARAATQLLRHVRRVPALDHQPQEGLAGALRTLLIALRAHPEAARRVADGERGARACGMLLSDCLFAVPESPRLARRRAKCSGPRARRAARDLLRWLAAWEGAEELETPEAGRGVVLGGGEAPGGVTPRWRLKALMVRALADVHAESPRLATWAASPAVDPGLRNATGFCGLTNQGATCYLNSILQQLYMIPMLREGLLAAPAGNEASEEGAGKVLLWQLQRVLHFLRGGVQRFTDPMDLVEACAGQLRLAHDVHLQNDAQEFVDQLLGALESQLKGTSQENLLRLCFGGVLCHQCFARASPSGGAPQLAGQDRGGAGAVLRRPDVDEPFLFLELAVKNKAAVVESLQDFVKVEQVDGLHWEGQAEGVRSMKRTCIKTLPQCLLFNLKRYEFNLTTLTRDKVNDYYTFPEEINMWPYTQEGIDALASSGRGGAEASGFPSHSSSQGGSDHGSIPNRAPAEWESDKYMYRLRGVVVQSGTEKSGHYYSFIQDRVGGKWYKFNDQTVTPFDPCNIPHECFGGTERITLKRTNAAGQRCDVPKERAVTRSAYILLYERTSCDGSASESSLEASSMPKPFPGPDRASQLPPTRSPAGTASRRCPTRDARGANKVAKENHPSSPATGRCGKQALASTPTRMQHDAEEPLGTQTSMECSPCSSLQGRQLPPADAAGTSGGGALQEGAGGGGPQRDEEMTSAALVETDEERSPEAASCPSAKRAAAVGNMHEAVPRDEQVGVERVGGGEAARTRRGAALRSAGPAAGSTASGAHILREQPASDSSLAPTAMSASQVPGSNPSAGGREGGDGGGATREAAARQRFGAGGGRLGFDPLGIQLRTARPLAPELPPAVAETAAAAGAGEGAEEEAPWWEDDPLQANAGKGPAELESFASEATPHCEVVRASNTAFLRAIQVFDLDHVQFVRDLLAIVSASVPGGDGGVVEAATRMGTDFFQQFLVRFEGRSAVHLDHWLMPLRVLYTRAGPGTCRDFLLSLQTETLREHLLECPDLPTRQAFQHLLMHVVDMVNADESSLHGADAKPLNLGPNPEAGPSDGGVYVDPASVAAHSSLCRLVQSLLALATEVPEGPHALRSAQLFHTISWLTSLSTLSAYLLRCEVAPVLVEVFMSVGNDGPIPFAGHEHLLYAIDFLVAPVVNALIPRPAGAESPRESAPLTPLDRAASPGASPPPDSPPLEEEPVPALPLNVRASLPPRTERAVLRNIPFLRRAVMRGGSPAAAARLCVAACAGWRETECALPAALMPALGSASSHEACLQVLMALVARQDPSQEDRVHAILGSRTGVLCCAHSAATNQQLMRCHHFITALSQLSSHPAAAAWLLQNRFEWEWTIQWLEANCNSHALGGNQPGPHNNWSPEGSDASQAALEVLSLLRKRAYEEAGELFPDEQVDEVDAIEDDVGDTLPGSASDTQSTHRALEKEVAKQLTEMGYSNPHVWAAKAINRLPQSRTLSKDSLNDAIAWVLNHSQGSSADEDLYSNDSNGPHAIIQAAHGDLPTDTIELSTNLSL